MVVDLAVVGAVGNLSGSSEGGASTNVVGADHEVIASRATSAGGGGVVEHAVGDARGAGRNRDASTVGEVAVGSAGSANAGGVEGGAERDGGGEDDAGVAVVEVVARDARGADVDGGVGGAVGDVAGDAAVSDVLVRAEQRLSGELVVVSGVVKGSQRSCVLEEVVGGAGAASADLDHEAVSGVGEAEASVLVVAALADSADERRAVGSAVGDGAGADANASGPGGIH